MLSLGKNARHLGIELGDKQLAQFDVYKNELLQWNAKTNLISENSSQEIITRHFLDSLTALQFIQKPNARIIDVGCGAGFPGLDSRVLAVGVDRFRGERGAGRAQPAEQGYADDPAPVGHAVSPY